MDSTHFVADKAIGLMQDTSKKLFSVVRDKLHPRHGMTSFEVTQLQIGSKQIIEFLD